MPETFKMYKNAGVRGLMVEGSHLPGSAEFMKELKAYLVAKMMWSVQADVKKHRDDFLNGYYGEAGKLIAQWLDTLHQLVEDNKTIHGSCWPARDFERAVDAPLNSAKRPLCYIPIMTSHVMDKCDRIFNEAENAADTEQILERIQRARLSLDYVKIMRLIHSTSQSGTPEERALAYAQLKDFIRRCKAHGFQRIELGPDIDRSFEALGNMLRE
jgi:hypothetical protein